MDVASVLEEYLADIATLPSDVAFILEEIRVKDTKLVDLQKRIQQRDEIVQKYVKNNGAALEGPKEQSLYPKIRADFEEALTLQREKTQLATMGLYLVAKQVKVLDEQVAQVQQSGVVFPPPEDQEEVYSSAEPSPLPAQRPARKSVSEGSRRASRANIDKEKEKREKDSRSEKDRKRKSESQSSQKAAVADAVSGASAAPAAADLSTKTAGKPDGTKSVSEPAHEEGRVAVEVNGTRVSLKRDHNSTRHIPGTDDVEAFCYCKKPSVGNMIACDSDNCEIEWFHWECVGLTGDPVGAWFCPQCRDKIKKVSK
ncbi:histone acetyltransferase [Starmerella bacillaris]|uniref:Chromatin modification-related protein n=1 Tax=Starmerella bacillaris TaxID=1247836 RepID=A0AAV5RNC0_STABA|nr:histone acetyltransferase [Starmerella bacillaris]